MSKERGRRIRDERIQDEYAAVPIPFDDRSSGTSSIHVRDSQLYVASLPIPYVTNKLEEFFL